MREPSRRQPQLRRSLGAANTRSVARPASGIRERRAPLTPGQKLGRYQIVARLGAGRTAEVWLATSGGARGFLRHVVLKTLRAELADDPDMVALFVREATIAAELAHPRVVSVRDLGVIEGTHFMEMPHVAGATLRQLEQRLRERLALLPLALALELIVDVCDGLEYVHRAADDAGRPLQLVHRDVSPENILVTFIGTAELLDFGLVACPSRPPPPTFERFRGRPQYLAPESQSGAGPDAPTRDVYAVGVILYELLTGRRPEHRHPEPPPPSAYNPRVPPALDVVVLASLAPSPAARPADGGVLSARLRRILEVTSGRVARPRLGAALASLFPEREDLPASIRADAAEAGAALEEAAWPSPELPDALDIELSSSELRDPEGLGGSEAEALELSVASGFLATHTPVSLDFEELDRALDGSACDAESGLLARMNASGLDRRRASPSSDFGSGPRARDWLEASLGEAPVRRAAPPELDPPEQAAVAAFAEGLEQMLGGDLAGARRAWAEAARLAPENRVIRASLGRLERALPSGAACDPDG